MITKSEVDNLSHVLGILSDHGPGTEDFIDQFRDQYEEAWDTVAKLEAEVAQNDDE